MAIKDWKKIENYVDDDIIFSNDRKKITARIHVDERPIRFIVINTYLPGVLHDKTFKTKQEALKYAKEYMREN